MLRNTGGQYDHGFAIGFTFFQIVDNAGLDRHLRGVHIPGHFHPFGHDLFDGLIQAAVLFGKFCGEGEYGVRHAGAVFLGIRIAAFGEKRLVHAAPNPVGIDQCAVHIKYQHVLSSVQKRHGKSTASAA